MIEERRKKKITSHSHNSEKDLPSLCLSVILRAQNPLFSALPKSHSSRWKAQ